MKKTQHRIIRMLAILGFIQLSFFTQAQVVPNIDWVQYYSEAAQINNVASALDGNNSVYLTGYANISSTLIAMKTLKYDSLGNNIYTATYTFNGAYDKGNAIRVDASGNAYIAGISKSTTTGNDFIIVKYSPSGTQLWATSIFMHNSNKIDEAYDLKLDASGNVFVTGRGTNSSGNADIFTAKLNNSGVVQWKKAYNGAANKDDSGVALVLASNGNSVFVTGSTTNASNNKDIIVIAYNAATGAENWKKVVTGTANSNDVPTAIVLSGANIVFTGQVDNTTTGKDCITMKMACSNGTQVWQKVYDFSNSTNLGTALVKDSTGNIGVTGTAYNGSYIEIHSILYDSTGTQLWVNILPTGLNFMDANPKIATDTIANHFYISGQIQKATTDVLCYQITPIGGITSWSVIIDGAANGTDASTNLLVNGVGQVYLSAHCKNISANYDYTTIKLSQTPTYTIPNAPSSTDVQSQNWIYYENKGQVLKTGTTSVANDVSYYTQFSTYPEYIGLNKMSYKIAKQDTTIGVNDTTQRIDILYNKSNTYTYLYPYNIASGLFNFLHGEAMLDKVVDVKGYRNLGIPNIYTSIDQHYTSNADGMKIQYVLKPYAAVQSIEWQILGADSVKIVSNKLEIYHHRGKIVWDQPVVYTVDSLGNPQSITGSATWTLTGGGYYGISTPTYNINKPLIIELDHGSTVFPPYPAINNLVASLYYGGWTDEGFIDIDVDPITKNWVAVGSTRGGDYANAFPISPGAQISLTSYTNTPNEYMFVLVFKSDGTLVTANTYGLSGYMKPLRAILNGTLVTVVGNCNIAGQLPLYTSQQAALTAGTYTYATGQGYVMQFEITTAPSSTIQSINTIRWTTRLNGNASDIDVTPDGKHIYVTSSTHYSLTPMQGMTQTGSYNNGGVTSLTDINFQVWKFDSLGVRKWSSILPIINSTSSPTTGNVPLYNEYSNTALVMSAEYYLKCKIKTDNYGFYLTGETNSGGNLSYSKYGAPFDASHNGFNDGFFARFNKRDSLVYCSYVGGNIDDAFNELSIVNPNEVALIGYSNSKQSGLLTAPSTTEYSDTSMDNSLNTKLLICKFDSIGNKKWATFYGKNSFSSNAVGWSITHDNKGYIYMTGMNDNKLPSFTNSSSLFSQSSIINTESFMLGFDSGNQPVWNTKFGGVEDDIGLALDFNNHQGTNYIIMGGMTPSRSQPYLLPSMSYSFPVVEKPFGSVTTWTQTYVIIGRSDGFFSFFTTDVVTGIEEYFKDKNSINTFELFPNPTQYETNIAFKDKLEGKVSIEIYNQMGQVVAILEEKDVPAFSLINISTANIPPGLYIVNVKNRGKSYSKKLIISR